MNRRSQSVRKIPTPYEMGVDFISREDHEWTTHRLPFEGFAVYSACEGETPQFERFFTARWVADRYAAKTDAEGDPLFYDAGVFEAVIVTEGLVIANDYTLDTHEKLLERIEAWRAKGWEGSS